MTWGECEGRGGNGKNNQEEARRRAPKKRQGLAEGRLASCKGTGNTRESNLLSVIDGDSLFGFGLK